MLRREADFRLVWDPEPGADTVTYQLRTDIVTVRSRNTALGGSLDWIFVSGW